MQDGKLFTIAALGVHAVSATAGAVLLALMMWAGPSRLPSALWGAAFIVLKVGSSKKRKTAGFADLLAVQVFFVQMEKHLTNYFRQNSLVTLSRHPLCDLS